MPRPPNVRDELDPGLAAFPEGCQGWRFISARWFAVLPPSLAPVSFAAETPLSRVLVDGGDVGAEAHVLTEQLEDASGLEAEFTPGR
jgi:hypothetical protein